MSGNICRCSAYPQIVAAIRDAAGEARHEAFTYERPDDVGGRRAGGAASPGAKFIAGGTNLLDLMKLEIEHADASGRRLPPAAGARSRTTADGGLRIGATGHQHRPRRRPPRARSAIRCCREALAGRRLGPAAQQGHDRRATCCSAPAAPISTTPPSPAISAQPGTGCSALEGLNRIHADPRRERCLHRHPSLRHGRRPGGAGRRGRDAVRRRAGGRIMPIAELHRLPGETPQNATPPWAAAS